MSVSRAPSCALPAPDSVSSKTVALTRRLALPHRSEQVGACPRASFSSPLGSHSKPVPSGRGGQALTQARSLLSTDADLHHGARDGLDHCRCRGEHHPLFAVSCAQCPSEPLELTLTPRPARLRAPQLLAFVILKNRFRQIYNPRSYRVPPRCVLDPHATLAIERARCERPFASLDPPRPPRWRPGLARQS